jgi:tripartite motif-containing protein 71
LRVHLLLLRVIHLLDKGGSFGSDNGQFHLPWSLDLDSSNNVYVVDRNNERIQKFDNSGNFIATWSPARFQQPVGIAIDSLNNVYVTVIDNGFNVVNKYTTEGSLVKSWVVGGRNLSSLDTQNAIATDSSNNVYVTDKYDIRVEKFTSDGNFIKS